jgi:type IV secretion system protein VirD4
MEQFFGQVFSLAADYWWLIIIAWALSGFVKPDDGVAAAIDEFKPDNKLGGAAMAENKALRKAGLFRGKGIPIGYSPDGKHELHYNGQGHLLTVCGARGGKGVSLLLPAQLSWAGSAVIFDSKAENVVVAGHHRRRYGPVFVLNPVDMFPDELKGLRRARFNPLDILDTKSPSFHIDCDKIAAALIVEDGMDSAHWVGAARILVSGIIAALVRHAEPSRRHLVDEG